MSLFGKRAEGKNADESFYTKDYGHTGEMKKHYENKYPDSIRSATAARPKRKPVPIQHERQLSAFRLGELDTLESLRNSTLLLPPDERREDLKYVQPFLYPCDEPAATKEAFGLCKNRTDLLLKRFNQSILQRPEVDVVAGPRRRVLQPETSNLNAKQQENNGNTLPSYHTPILITTMSHVAEQQRPEFVPEKQIQIFCPLVNFVHNPDKHCDDYPEYTFTNQRSTYNVTQGAPFDVLAEERDNSDTIVAASSSSSNGREKLVSGEVVSSHTETTTTQQARNNTKKKVQQSENEFPQTLFWYISCMSQGCDMDLPDNRHSRGCVGLPCRSAWPSFMVDTLFERNRKLQMLAYLYDVRGELYWEVDQFNSTTDLLHFGGNGDGQLIYPEGGPGEGEQTSGRAAEEVGGKTAQSAGEDGVGTPEQQQTLASEVGPSTARALSTGPSRLSSNKEKNAITNDDRIPLASIRLKHIRDGLEDLEYLYLLEDALLGLLVTTGTTLDGITVPHPAIARQVHQEPAAADVPLRNFARSFIIENFVRNFVRSTVDTVAVNGTWMEERRKLGEAIGEALAGAGIVVEDFLGSSGRDGGKDIVISESTGQRSGKEGMNRMRSPSTSEIFGKKVEHKGFSFDVNNSELLSAKLSPKNNARNKVHENYASPEDQQTESGRGSAEPAAIFA
ncbi:unnamed protein product [Amoebophrya sp. A120]|nr:unnamed protein product [Amoebophrya sp. A120]|eukprot:GSA120T00010990001.1